MAYRLIWSPTARLDLNEIADYIAEDDPVAAKKFVRHLIQIKANKCVPTDMEINVKSHS